MTKKAIDFFGSRAMVVLMLLWLFALAAAHYWPASYWFEVSRIQVAPARAWQSVPMLVKKHRINHPFTGEWTVTIRKWESGGWVAYCTASGSGNYRSGSGSELPANLTLALWTNNQCAALPEGRYTMGTAWTVNVPGLPPDKEVYADSNIFEIGP